MIPPTLLPVNSEKSHHHASVGALSKDCIALVYWGSRGGGSQMTLNLARRLREELGSGNVVVFLRTQNAELDEFMDAGFEPHLADIPGFRSVVSRWLETVRLIRRQAEQIARLRPSVVVFTMNFPLAWPLVHFLQRRRIRVAYIVHDANPHPGDYAQLWQRSTQGLLVRFSDRIIALSEHTYRILAERLPKRAQRLRHTPLQSVMRARVDQPRLPIHGRPVRLLFLGRLVEYKGLDMLAEALKPLRGRDDWSLTIAGDGPMRMKVAASFQDWPNVSLDLRWLESADFENYLQSHDVLLCPYTEASQSGVVAEALTFAVPSLVMPNGELPNQIGHGQAGTVAAASTAPAFQALIESVLEHPVALSQMSRGALDLASARSAESLASVILS